LIRQVDDPSGHERGGEFRDGLVLVSEIFDGPPSGWDEANAIT
jgi:hypothetical protein